LSKEFQRLSGQVSEQVLALANRCWAAACNEATAGVREENVRLRRRLEALEVDLAASTDLLVQVEEERDEKVCTLNLSKKEKEELARQCDDLTAGLRNAESDLRATQKTIDNFERNQRQDRDEIRQLQRRIEDLVAECATLKANASETSTSRTASGRKKRI
jgi:chromosome segregation ATPase